VCIRSAWSIERSLYQSSDEISIVARRRGRCNCSTIVSFYDRLCVSTHDCQQLPTGRISIPLLLSRSKRQYAMKSLQLMCDTIESAQDKSNIIGRSACPELRRRCTRVVFATRARHNGHESVGESESGARKRYQSGMSSKSTAIIENSTTTRQTRRRRGRRGRTSRFVWAAVGLALATTSWHDPHVDAAAASNGKVEDDRWRKDSVDGTTTSTATGIPVVAASTSPYMMVR
jgi:hypothetical protein